MMSHGVRHRAEQEFADLNSAEADPDVMRI
jgi:hypothetical protein